MLRGSEEIKQSTNIFSTEAHFTSIEQQRRSKEAPISVNENQFRRGWHRQKAQLIFSNPQQAHET